MKENINIVLEDSVKRLATSFVAGLLIVIGCVANLKVGGVAGGVLFSFALATIVVFQLDLLTGLFGYDSFNYKALGITLVGNMLGCFLGGLVFSSFLTGIQEAAELVIYQRMLSGSLSNLLLAIPCGMIVTIAIGGVAENTYIPLLIGVPIFVLCGFPHCVADFGYICMARTMYWAWPLTIVGNYLGCNFYRVYLWENPNNKRIARKKVGFHTK